MASAMPVKHIRDTRLADRIRAHLRERMEARGWGPAETARAIGMDQGHLTKIFQGSRGVGSELAARMSVGLGIPLEWLFKHDPPPGYWRRYVPHRRHAPPSGGPDPVDPP